VLPLTVKSLVTVAPLFTVKLLYTVTFPPCAIAIPVTHALPEAFPTSNLWVAV